MASGFAPEFLILLGIDIFLGASILTVLLDRHFPSGVPYVLEGAALIGFAELMAGPTFLNSFSPELQFYYSFTFAMISVLTLFATNLYLLFLRRRPFESAVLGICGTIPAGLGILYFTSAFVNGATLSLPLVPVIPIEGVYAMFGLSIGLVIFSLVVFGRRIKPVIAPEAAERPQEQPLIIRSAEGPGQVVLVEDPLADAPATRRDEGPPKGVTDFSNSGTVLVKRVEDKEYAKRLVDAIKSFEKAVDHPVKVDPSLLGSTFKGAKKAYLSPAGILIVEDSKGKVTSTSIMDISTDEALQVMRQAMKGIVGSEELP